MEALHSHYVARLEVYLRVTDDDPRGPYLAQLTGEGSQRVGHGQTPRDAIIDSLGDPA